VTALRTRANWRQVHKGVGREGLCAALLLLGERSPDRERSALRAWSAFRGRAALFLVRGVCQRLACVAEQGAGHVRKADGDVGHDRAVRQGRGQLSKRKGRAPGPRGGQTRDQSQGQA
jgi:hypothetical protein